MAETTRIMCPRCDGRGILPQYYYNRKGICFKCWGRKYITVEIPKGMKRQDVISKLRKEQAEFFKNNPPKVDGIPVEKQRNKQYWATANSKVDVGPEASLTDAELAEIRREVDGMTPMQMTETQKALRKQEASKGFDDLSLKDQLRVVARRKMLEARMTKEGIPFEKPKGTPKPNPNPNPNGKKGTKSKPEFETISKVGTYTIDKGQHTQTGADLYRVKNSKRLSREDFKKESAEMKKMGGYYSKFVGGYLFKEDPTDKLADTGVGKKSKADELKDAIDAIVNDTSKDAAQRIMSLERFHQVEVNAAARNGEINKKEHMALFNYGQDAINRVKEGNKSPAFIRIMDSIDDIIGNYPDDEERLKKYRALLVEARGLHGDGELTDAEYRELDNTISDLRMDIKERLYKKKDTELGKHQEEVLLPKLLEKHDPYSAEGLQALHDEIAKTWEDSTFKNQYLRDLQEQIREEIDADIVGIYMERADEILDGNPEIFSPDDKMARLVRLKIEALQDKSMTSKGRNRADEYISGLIAKLTDEIRESKDANVKWFMEQREKRKEILKPKAAEFKDTPLGRKAAEVHRMSEKTVEDVIAIGTEARKRLDEIRAEMMGDLPEVYGKAQKEYDEAYREFMKLFRSTPQSQRKSKEFVDANNRAYFAKLEVEKHIAKRDKVLEAAYRQLLSEIREKGDTLNIGGEDGRGNRPGLSAKNHDTLFNKYAEFFPKQWVDASNLTPMGTERVKDKRAAYNPAEDVKPGAKNFQYSTLEMNSKTKPGTVVHELMHRMEHINPNIHKLSNKFYEKRTVGQESKWLGAGYKRNERYRELGKGYEGRKWVSTYMGKDYAWSKYTDEDGNEHRFANEMMTMGIQTLVYGDHGYDSTDSSKYSMLVGDSEDTEYYDFVMGVIASV